jgi:hypothetical protein
MKNIYLLLALQNNEARLNGTLENCTSSAGIHFLSVFSAHLQRSLEAAIDHDRGRAMSVKRERKIERDQANETHLV